MKKTFTKICSACLNKSINQKFKNFSSFWAKRNNFQNLKGIKKSVAAKRTTKFALSFLE